jgi:hypothetical protein
MKKLIRMLLLMGVVLGGVRPGFSQLLASAHQIQQKEGPVKASPQKLKDVLKKLQDHYAIDILFFDRNVEGLVVAGDVINYKVNIEQNLTAVLKPLGLRYRKVKNGGYVVVARESVEKTEASSGQTSLGILSSPDRLDSDIENRPGALGLPTKLPTEKLAPVDIPVQGSVTDDKGEGLPGVSIVIKGSQKGTTTDAEGKYKIDVPNVSATLIFSYVGYVPQEVTVGTRTTVDVTLKADDKTLDEIVVVGYGTVKKKDLTGSVGVISSKEVKDPGRNTYRTGPGRASCRSSGESRIG